MDGLAPVKSQRKGLVLSRRHALSAREQGIRHLDRNYRIQEVLEELQWPLGPLGEFTNVYVNGVLITPEYYQTAIVTPDDYLAVVLVPKGGGGGGGKKTGKAVLQVVALVAMQFIPGVGQALAGAILPSIMATGSSVAAWTTAANLITAGLGVAAALAMGALFGPRFKQESDSVERSYTVGGSSNQATPYNSVIRLYGRHLMSPRIAAKPYGTSNGVNSYSTLLLDFGYGEIQVEDVKVGNSVANSVQDFQYVVHKNIRGPYEGFQFYKADVDQQDINVELRRGKSHIFTSSADTDQIEFDIAFPQGMYIKDTKKGYLSTEDNAWTIINVSIREAGTTDWQPWQALASMYLQPYGYAPHRAPHGSIAFSGYERRAFIGSTGLRLNKKARWDVRIERVSTDWDTENTSATWYPTTNTSFVAIRSLFLGKSPINTRAAHTMMEVFVRANEQASGVLQEINAIATSVLRVWNGSSFEMKPTRNPAWIYADVLTGESNPRPLTDDKIDWDNLLYWANFCDQLRDGEPLYYYDAVHDSSTTVWDQIQLVATAGRASPTRRDGKYGVIIDTEQTVPVQMFTMLNSSEHSINKAFLDLPHALRVKFVDPNLDWKVNEILVYDDGYNESNSTKFEELQLRGVTRYNQAWRDARHWFAAAKLRREEVSFKTDVENLVCQRGDLVLWQSDVNIVGGMAARIVAINGSRITIDAPAGILSGSLGIRIRSKAGLSQVFSVTQVDEYTFNVNGGFSAQVGDLLVYGNQQTVTGQYLVKEIAAGPNLSAEITLCEVGQGIYLADQGAIPPYVPQGGGIEQTIGGPVINLSGSCNVYFQDWYPYADVQLGWGMPANVIPPLKYNVYQLIDGEFGSIGQTTELGYFPYLEIDLFASDYTDGQVLTFEVEPVWSSLTGPRARTTVTMRVPAPQPAPSPKNLVANWIPAGITAQWTDPKDDRIVSYNLRLISSQGVAVQAPQTSVHAYLFPDVRAGDYTVEVVAVDWRGTLSDPATVPVNVPAVPAVSFIGYFLDKAGIRVRWATLEWPGIVDYILREPGGAPDRVINGTSITLNPRVSGSYPISVVGRDRLGQESIAPATTTMIIPPVAPPTFVEGHWTQNGIVFSWVASTALWLEGYVIEEDGKEPIKTASTSFVMELRKAGTYTFRVRAVNSVGEKSVPVAVMVVVPEVPVVQDALATVRPDGIELTWKNVEGFNVVGYVIRRTSAAAIEGAAPIYEYLGPIFIQSNKYLLPPHLAGEYQYSIHAVDTLTQESSGPALVSFVILLPKSTRISGNSVSNTAFLRWGSLSGAEGWSAQTSHMIEFYELTRLRLSSDTSRWQMLGFRSAQQLERMQTAQARYSLNPMVVRSSGIVEKFAVEFAYIDETEPGRWRYCIRAVDVAGNRGPFECMELMLNSPDNYELLDYLDNWLPVSDMHHCVPFDGDWLAPVNPNQTYEDHFIDNGNESPQDQIDKGWPIFIQPGDSPATARWEHDFGIDMPPIMVSIGTKFITLAESLSIVSRIYYRAENETEWTLGAEDMKLDIISMMRDKTRYIALEIELHQDAQRFGLAQLQSAYYRLDVKYMTDQGIVDVDAAGTHVVFTKYFLDVRSVQLSVQNVGDVFFSRYTVDQDQKGMTIYCFDSIGNPTTGRVSWLVRGV